MAIAVMVVFFAQLFFVVVGGWGIETDRKNMVGAGLTGVVICAILNLFIVASTL